MAVIEYVDRAEAENLASEANILVLTGLSIFFVFSNNRFVKTCNSKYHNLTDGAVVENFILAKGDKVLQINLCLDSFVNCNIL